MSGQTLQYDTWVRSTFGIDPAAYPGDADTEILIDLTSSGPPDKTAGSGENLTARSRRPRCAAAERHRS